MVFLKDLRYTWPAHNKRCRSLSPLREVLSSVKEPPYRRKLLSFCVADLKKHVKPTLKLEEDTDDCYQTTFCRFQREEQENSFRQPASDSAAPVEPQRTAKVQILRKNHPTASPGRYVLIKMPLGFIIRQKSPDPTLKQWLIKHKHVIFAATLFAVSFIPLMIVVMLQLKENFSHMDTMETPPD